jgi:thioesterase domain-containing protein/acyl carrier protein
MDATHSTDDLNALILRLLREAIPRRFAKKDIRPDMSLQNELGITSLGKIVMVCRLEEEFGVKFSPSIIDVREIRTVKDLSDTSKRMAEEAQGGSFNQLTKKLPQQEKITFYPSFTAIQSTPFIAIRPGGVKPPFYACGHHPVLTKLAQVVGVDRPFYKVDGYALLEERMGKGYDMDVRIEEMAARFVQEVLASQPVGPYYLGGGCESAIIAFEMAQQLESLGHRIAMLVIWDTPASKYWQNEGAPVVSIHRLHRLFSGGRVGLKRRLSSLLDRTSNAFITAGAWRSSHHTDIEKALTRSVKSYVAKSYRGRIILFRASESVFECPEPTLGWGELAEQGVDIRTLPGNHTSYYEQNFSGFAEMVNVCLIETQTSDLDANLR